MCIPCLASCGAENKANSDNTYIEESSVKQKVEKTHQALILESEKFATKTSWNKLRISPNSQYAALINNKKIGVIHLSDKQWQFNEVSASQKSYFDFSPDSQEIWLTNSKDQFERLSASSVTKLNTYSTNGKKVFWKVNTQIPEVSLEASDLTRYFFEDKRQQQKTALELTGQLMLTSQGQLFHAGETLVFINAPDHVTRWRKGRKVQSTSIPFKPSLAMLACNDQCLLTAENSRSEITYIWSLTDIDQPPTQINMKLFNDISDKGNKRLSIDNKGRIAAKKNGTLHLVKPNLTGIEYLGPTAEIPKASTIRLAQNGDRIVVSSNENKKLKILDGNTLSEFTLPPIMGENQSKSIIGPYARTLVATGKNNEALLINLKNVSLLSVLSEQYENIALQYSPSGRWLVKQGEKNITFYDSNTGASVLNIAPPDKVTQYAFTFDEKHLVLVFSNGDIDIHRLNLNKSVES